MVVKREYKVVGTRPVRPDGTDKVTGRAVYGADVRQQGTLYGSVKRSPHAHANIKRIDASKALALDGVRAVTTAADFPDPGDRIVPTIRGPVPLRWNIDRVMASGKVLFRGQPVAAVCATDPHLAEDALDLIEVEYEVLPPVMSAEEATLPSAPILLDDGLATAVDGLFDPVDGAPTNIARRVQMGHGDGRCRLRGSRSHHRARVQHLGRTPGATSSRTPAPRSGTTMASSRSGPARREHSVSVRSSPSCSRYRCRRFASSPRRSEAASAASCSFTWSR